MHRAAQSICFVLLLASASPSQTKPDAGPKPAAKSPTGSSPEGDGLGNLTPAQQAKIEQRLQAMKEAMQLPGAGPKASKMVLPRKDAPVGRTIAPADRNLSPEELRAKYKPKGQLSNAYVTYETRCEPASLESGASGTLTVLMKFKNDAVMLAAGPSSIAFVPRSGALVFDQPALRPADKATIAPAFRGKPAYDMIAYIDVPVQASAAASGAQAVDLTLSFELFDSHTGGHLDVFRDQVVLQVPIAGPGAAVADRGTTGHSGGIPPAVQPADDQARLAADAAAPVAAPETGAGPPPGPGGNDDGSAATLLLAALGALAGLALLLFARRR